MIVKVGQLSHKSDNHDISSKRYNLLGRVPQLTILWWVGGGCRCQLSNYTEIELQEVTDRCKFEGWVNLDHLSLIGFGAETFAKKAW